MDEEKDVQWPKSQIIKPKKTLIKGGKDYCSVGKEHWKLK